MKTDILNKYVKVKDLPQHCPMFTQSALRHMIRQNKDGIKECIIRIGHRIFFDLEKFSAWVEKHKTEQ